MARVAAGEAMFSCEPTPGGGGALHSSDAVYAAESLKRGTTIAE